MPPRQRTTFPLGDRLEEEGALPASPLGLTEYLSPLRTGHAPERSEEDDHATGKVEWTPKRYPDCRPDKVEDAESEAPYFP